MPNIYIRNFLGCVGDQSFNSRLINQFSTNIGYYQNAVCRSLHVFIVVV
jgi:hypothetical protein